MIHARPRRKLPMAAAITLVLLGAAASHADEKPSWSYGLGAAVSTPYGYRIDEQPAGTTTTTTFDPGLLLSATATRTFTRHTSLVFSTGYRGYSNDVTPVTIPAAPRVTSTLRSDYFSFGVGLRIEPQHGSGPYMQVLPAVFVSRWGETTVDQAGSDPTGERTTHTDSFRSVLPGIELSAGFRARFWKSLGTDFALKLTSSADLGDHDLGRFSSGKFHGLDEFALVGGITWSP